MVDNNLFNKLLSLVKQNIVKYSDIKNTDYKTATDTELKAEVANNTITTDRYKEITGVDYIAS